MLQQKLEADEQLVEKLMQQETSEDVQALLKENGVDLTIEEVNEIREVLLKLMDRMSEGELSEEDLEEVTGGIGVLAAVGIGMAIYSLLGAGGLATTIATRWRW